MVHVKGICRRLIQRFSRDFEGRVKYSTLWPPRKDSPSAARRAMPISRGLSPIGSKGRGAMIRLLFAHATAGSRSRQYRNGRDFVEFRQIREEPGVRTEKTVGPFRRAAAIIDSGSQLSVCTNSSAPPERSRDQTETR